MRFAKLFPPGTADSKPETCTIADANVALDSIAFSTIPQQDIPDITFIDGGSAVLFSTPTRAFGIIKICEVRTKGLKRESVKLHQYLVSVTRDGAFTIRSEPLAGADPAVSACLDGEIESPDATPEQLIDTLRALAERAIVPASLTVHDGSLRTTDPLLQRCAPSKDTFALAKSSAIITSRSRPLGVALLQRAPAGTWAAQLCDNTIKTWAVRLHQRAAHVFLLEGTREEPALLSALAAWSQDITFPGYPYPLVLADQLGRVTNNERDAWRLILRSDAQAAEVIADESRAQDAHAQLEHILYGR
jgi:hypothetical protein